MGNFCVCVCVCVCVPVCVEQVATTNSLPFLFLHFSSFLLFLSDAHVGALMQQICFPSKILLKIIYSREMPMWVHICSASATNSLLPPLS